MTERSFALGLASLVTLALIAGQAMDGYSWFVMRMPVITGGLSVLLLLAIAALSGPNQPTLPSRISSGLDLRRDLRGMAQVALALPVLWLCGFVAGPGLFALIIVRYHKHSWWLAIVIGVATSAFAYTVFRQLLNVRIPLGPLIGQ